MTAVQVDSEVVATGWQQVEITQRPHWIENSRPLCKARLSGFVIGSDDRAAPTQRSSACRACLSELVRADHSLPFRVGQRVSSNAQNIRITGVIVALFEDRDGQPVLDITRDKPQRYDPDTDHGLTDWYRCPHECTALEAPMTATSSTPKKPRKSKPAKIHEAAAPGIAQMFVPGTFVTIRLEGEDAHGLVRIVNPSATTLTVQFRNGVSRSVSADACRVFSLAHRAPLGVGDSVTCIDSETYSGEYAVLSVDGDDVKTEHVWGGQASQRIFLPSLLLVCRRKHLADALLDLGLGDAARSARESGVDFGGQVPVTAPPLPSTVAELAPGTLGIHELPLSQTVRSNCNVRHHYDPTAIEELAASLASQGQLENATGRWNAEGQVEIVAGESRRRAQLLRVERGEISADFPFLVQIRELNDGDALAISATENMRRRSMTGLEECEAMLRLQEAGRTPEAISAMFGYKTVQPVVERILVAKNLHTTARDLLDKGQLSLAQAFVIARAPGNDLQLSMTSNATHAHNPSSAKQLADQLSRGQFLVSTAKFRVEDSGLEVRRDLFDAYEPFFEDKAKALDAQITWAKARAKRIEEAGKRAFAHVITGSSYSFSTYDHKQYEYANESDKHAGTVLYIRSETGELKEEKSVKLKGKTVAAAPNGQTTAVREMPVSAYLEAHQIRAVAARSAVVGNTHLTLALTVWGLILGSSASLGRVHLGTLNGTGIPEFIPDELKARRAALVELLNPLTATGKDAHLAGISSGLNPDRKKLLELLVDMTDEQLLEHLNTLTSMTAYDWSPYQEKDAPEPEYLYLAGLTDAAQRLAAAFTLTDEHLKRYPRHDLVALAEEAGLGRALGEDCTTLKEMRARILEHAERLHAEGFVPALVRFGTVNK